MRLKGKKVLVTGAGGFIGSHLVEELVKEGCSVTGLVQYNSNNNIDNLEFIDKKNINIVYGDIRDHYFMLEITKDIDVIFHLAALIAIPYSYIAPRDYIDTNIIGTQNILECGRINRIKKIILTSTSEVYGTGIYVPIDEKHPLQGQSPYSASKIGADKMAESYYLSFGLPITIVRPFNTFGPRQSNRAVIPTIISQALTKDEISIGALDTFRDFTYVKDTVRGFIMSAKCDKNLGMAINFGSGTGVTIEEIINSVSNILGKEFKIKQDKSRMRPKGSEVMRLLSDSSLAHSVVDWKPEYSFEDGLKETIEFVKKNINMFETNKFVY